MTVGEYNHTVNSLDWRAIEMLKVIRQADNDQVSTTVIREETGFDNSKVRYRREKLVDLDLIETRSRSSPQGVPMTYHSLSEKGEAAVRRGLLRDHDMGEPGNFDELVARIEDVESQFSAIQSDIRGLRDRIEGVEDNVESRLGGASNVDEDLQELREDVDDLKQKAKQERRGGLLR